MKVKISGLILAQNTAQLKNTDLTPIEAIRRIIVNFQQIGVFPILVMLDEAHADYRYDLSDYGVVFALIPNITAFEKIDIIKRGVAFLQPYSDTILYGSSTVPFFYVDTLQKLLDYPDPIIIPYFNERGGHPVVLRSQIFQAILDYTGPYGLQGLFRSLKAQRRYVRVNDLGTSLHIGKTKDLAQFTPIYSRTLLHPQLHVQLVEDKVLLNPQVKLLLFLIDILGSVSRAAGMMGISYSKSWKLIHNLEDGLQTSAVIRHQGGANNRRSELSPAGRTMLTKYMQLENGLLLEAQNYFQDIFNHI